MFIRYSRNLLCGLSLINLLGCNAPNQESKVEPGPATGEGELTASTPAPVEKINLFYDETTFIAQDGAFVHSLSVKGPVLLKVNASIESDAPVDIFFIPETTNSDEYLKLAKRIMVNKEINDGLEDFLFLFGEHESTNQTSSLDDIFNSPLAKKGAYKRYESKWVKLNPGEYSVVIDNTALFTPSRGDAPVTLQILYKDISEPTINSQKEESAPKGKPNIEQLLDSSE